MTLKTFWCGSLLALAVALGAACGDDTSNQMQTPDLSMPSGMNPDLAGGGCAQPADTCVANPTTHAELINGCAAADVVKEDITPFYPAQGYTGCKLPAPPQ